MKLCFRRLVPLLGLMCLVPAGAAADRAFLLAGGVQADEADGTAISLLGELELAERTWLSASVGRNSSELSRDRVSETDYADFGFDHDFDPVGMRLTVAYWGDSDALDSVDVRGTLYARGEQGSVSLDVERRDFEFELPPFDFLPRTSFPFSASGFGISAGVRLDDHVDLQLGAKHYDYSVEFSPQTSDRIRPLVSISRLSILSTLIDWRLSAGIGVDAGEHRWSLDIATARGSIDDENSQSITLSFLTPISTRLDAELSLGQDRSDVYGNVTVASVLLYYYGGS